MQIQTPVRALPVKPLQKPIQFGQTSKNVTDLDGTTYKQTIANSKLPVLIDLWAPWCGPCRRLGPVIDNIGNQNVGKINVFKANIDDHPNIAVDYNVSSIPTI